MLRTPPLPVAKADYLRAGILRVDGWLDPGVAVQLACLEVLQREYAKGDICEIGIYRGRSFLTLVTGLPDGTRAVAVDSFGDELGEQDRAAFAENLRRFGVADAVETVPSSSLDLEAGGFVAAGRRFRLFSVDGGHTADTTRNDLALAEATVVEGALVVLDDVLNPSWLGVLTGLLEYWASGGTLVPVAVVQHRMLLAPTPEDAGHYRALMAEHFAPALAKRDVDLLGHVLDVYHSRPWTVVDDEGGEGPVAGVRVSVPLADYESLQRLPGLEAELVGVREELARDRRETRRLRREVARQRRQLTAPLRRELARRYPRAARAARPVMAAARATRRAPSGG